METRSLATPPTSDGRRLSGYAARFNEPSQVLAERGKVFREVILPGAFARSLTAPPRGSVVALWNHGRDNRPPLGRSHTRTAPAPTLRLWEDADGLRFELDLPESAADVREAVERGDVWGMSFGFAPNAKDRWSTRDGVPRREVLDLDLWEVSVVVDPAYPTTSVGLRDRSTIAVPESAPTLSVARARLALADRG